MTAPAAPAPLTAAEQDQPRDITTASKGADRTFTWSITVVGTAVLFVSGGIAIFLGYQIIPALRQYHSSFFTQNLIDPGLNQFGIAEAILGTVEVALIAMLVSFPIAILLALFISEYSPTWLRSTLTSLVDLMAAIPSILYGVWGAAFMEPHLIFVARFINEYFGWFPLARVNLYGGSPSAAAFEQHYFAGSAFIAGVVISMMVIPIACSVMNGVFQQAPRGEREAALALGSTRWGMIRSVVLPFGRGGIIGGTMLGLGRALGETIAVLLIINVVTDIKFKPLETGTITISSMIANYYPDISPGAQLSFLLAAGFVLFVMTLGVNTIAAAIVARGRSSSGADI